MKATRRYTTSGSLGNSRKILGVMPGNPAPTAEKTSPNTVATRDVVAAAIWNCVCGLPVLYVHAGGLGGRPVYRGVVRASACGLSPANET